MLLALGLRVATRVPQRNVNTVTTNVPGPQRPLYAAGRRMLEAFPYVPLGGQVRVGVAIFSYDGGAQLRRHRRLRQGARHRRALPGHRDGDGRPAGGGRAPERARAERPDGWPPPHARTRGGSDRRLSGSLARLDAGRGVVYGRQMRRVLGLGACRMRPARGLCRRHRPREPHARHPRAAERARAHEQRPGHVVVGVRDAAHHHGRRRPGHPDAPPRPRPRAPPTLP